MALQEWNVYFPQQDAITIDEMLAIAMERKASDLHLKVGNHPHLRIDGDWCR